MQHYYAWRSADTFNGIESGQVYRFASRAGRSIWIAISPGNREALKASDPKVRFARAMRRFPALWQDR